jgi:Protein-tyrosine phosphatase
MAKTRQQLENEFQEIEFGQGSLDLKSTFVAKTNPTLNRYPGILTFNSNRVVLDQDEGETDYINASYIRVRRSTLFVCQNELLMTEFCSFSGFQLSQGVHRHSRTDVQNQRRLLADDFAGTIGVYRHAHLSRRKPDQKMPRILPEAKEKRSIRQHHSHWQERENFPDAHQENPERGKSSVNENLEALSQLRNFRCRTT